LGRLIPAGTGFVGSRKAKMIIDMRANQVQEYGEQSEKTEYSNR
jgi:hypothetical protein